MRQTYEEIAYLITWKNLRRILSFSEYAFTSSDEQVEEDLYKVDNFTIQDGLAPYEWLYMSVQLPRCIIFVFLEVEADADFGKKKKKIGQSSNLPVMCLRKGGLPLPDISSVASEGFFDAEINLQSEGQCYFVQDGVSIAFASEQIFQDIIFIGFFNGIGPIRTQAKMINRGPNFDLSTAIQVKDCKNQSMMGQYCNQTLEQLSCHNSTLNKLGQNVENIYNDGVTVKSLTCKKLFKESCHQDLASRTYFLELPGAVEELVISGIDLKSIEGQQPEKVGSTLMCYARFGAVPGNMSYDYALDLVRPLKISRPKIGTWYFNFQATGGQNLHRTRLQNCSELRYSVEWDVIECPEGTTGPNCDWPRYILQVSQRESSEAFLVSFSKQENVFLELHNLHLEPMLRNTSYGIGREADVAWTYFDIDVPQAASGKNIRIELIANTSISYQLYVRYNGLPSESDWDYYYINQRNNSDNGSSMFKLYKISKRQVIAYLLYPKAGLWSLGFRHHVESEPNSITELSFSLEYCPNQCSSHGSCMIGGVQGSTDFRYYFCKCDARYGGFDCSVQLVSLLGQRWHVVFLIASNAAVLLPAVFALHKKAYSECIIFLCSGISSALYHACDSGSWCALDFNVLQFMDFWLSFTAVLITVIYLAFIREDVRRTIHIISLIVTALVAVNGPTKSKNIPLVLALGAFALICAWFFEIFISHGSDSSLPATSSANIQHSLRSLVKVKSWFNLLKTLKNRFQWCYIFAGSVAFAMAALSWNLETPENYWLWHTVWHLSIYTSGFLFLWSRRSSSTIPKANIETAAAECDRS